MVLKDLLEKQRSNKKEALLSYLPRSDREAINMAPLPDRDPFSYDLSIEDRIKAIHYSWMIPLVEQFSKKDRTWILSSLESEQAEKLRLHFNMKNALKKIKAHPKQFLQNFIYHSLISTQKEVFPLEYLPAHPLNSILELSKNGMQHLADFLGLHDLSIEVKKVVKTKQLQQLQAKLPKRQYSYLKKLCKQREPVPFARLNLDSWDGDQTRLKQMLHQRGFNRLSKALFGCHPALMWHITRRLDTGRTKILRRFFTDVNNEKSQNALQVQVTCLIPLIRKYYE